MIALQADEQHVDQVVLKPIVLMGDKGDEVKVAVFLLAAGELENFRFDDAIGVVSDALRVERQGLEHGRQALVEVLDQGQIGHAFFDFGGFGGLRGLLH